MANMFKVGDTFDSFDDFYDLFKNWCTENFHPIHIEDSHAIQDEYLKETIKYKNIHISCLHAGTWKRPTTGKRQSKSLRRECPFGIKLACGKNSNVLEIKKANFQHNHEIGEELFLKYPKNRKPDANEIDMINNLIHLGCIPKKIVTEFREQTQKPFTVQDLKNLVKRNPDMPDLPKDAQEDQNFEAIVNNIMNDPANYVKLKRDSNNVITSLFFVLSCQKNWFEKFGNLTHIDATYRVNIENYVLYIFLCQDSLLRGLPVASCLMRTEQNENMDFMYESFSEVYDSNKVEIIMVDKDLQNLDLLAKYFPHAKVLLCTFHVIKYLKSVFSDLLIKLLQVRAQIHQYWR